MDCLMVMQVFVMVVDGGSLLVVVEQLDLLWLVVLCYVVELEDWVGVWLLYWIMWWFLFIFVGNELLLCCCQMLEYFEDMCYVFDMFDEMLCGFLCIMISIFFVQIQLIQVVVEYGCCYLGVVVDLLVLDCIVNLVEECIDLVICMINWLEFNLIVCLLGVCYLVICVMLDYFVCYGMLCKVEDLVLYNCLMYFYVGCSLWQFDLKKKKVRVGKGVVVVKMRMQM